MGYSHSPPEEVRDEESSQRAGPGEESKVRLRMLQHAQRVSGNVSQTCRFFGVSRALFYIWKKRDEKNGLAGWRDQSRRPRHIRYRIPPEIVSLIPGIREERRYGAVRTSFYLQRHYHANELS